MRTPTPRFRKQNQTWYVQIEGRHIRLGKNKKEAFAEYLRLMHLGVPKGDHTVRQILDAYWNWAKSNLAEETCNSRKAVLTSLGDSVPWSLKAVNVRAYHVQKSTAAWSRPGYVFLGGGRVWSSRGKPHQGNHVAPR